MTKAGLRAAGSLIGTVTLLMTVSVTGALAEAGSQWLVLTSGGLTKTTKELPVGVTGEISAGSKEVLLTKIAGAKIEKTCTSVETPGLKLEGESSIAPGAKLKFTGCKIFLNGAESKVCVPHTSGAPAGTLETTKLRGDLGLHFLLNEKGEKIKDEKTGEVILHGPIRLEPEVGETYMMLELGEECSIGEKVPIFGTFYAHDVGNKSGIETHQVKHVIEEGPGTTVWILNKTEEHKVILDGSATLFLNGAHAGLKWGGMIG
jgi:hypothetical protein